MRDLLKKSARFLRENGIRSADVDACVLLRFVIGEDPRLARVLPTRRQVEEYGKLLARRVAAEPVAYIVGEREFYGLPFKVSRDVLVPRPDSETLVDAVLQSVPKDWNGRILDLGTGSGALLLSVLSALPNARGCGVDVSSAAVAVARRNAGLLGLSSRVKFVIGDFSAPLSLRGKFDVVISNPPYVASGEIAGLEPDVRDFEPRAALDGGADGLDFYRALAAQESVRKAKEVFLEIGAGKAEAVERIFEGFGPARRHVDLGEIPRVLEFDNICRKC